MQGARTCCIYAFRSVVCIQHSIKKVLRVTNSLNALDEVQTPCITNSKEPPATYQLGDTPGGRGLLTVS